MKKSPYFSNSNLCCRTKQKAKNGEKVHCMIVNNKCIVFVLCTMAQTLWPQSYSYILYPHSYKFS